MTAVLDDVKSIKIIVEPCILRSNVSRNQTHAINKLKKTFDAITFDDVTQSESWQTGIECSAYITALYISRVIEDSYHPFYNVKSHGLLRNHRSIPHKILFTIK